MYLKPMEGNNTEDSLVFNGNAVDTGLYNQAFYNKLDSNHNCTDCSSKHIAGMEQAKEILGAVAKASLCERCGKPAPQKCGRCKEATYCSKECQVAAWPEHKKVCVDKVAAEKKRQEIYANFIIHANARITGNIFIMASHRYKTDGPGIILIEITETMQEFIKGGSIHFAHMNFVPSDKIQSAAEEHGLDLLEKHSIEMLTQDVSCVHVVYKLIDYYTVVKVTPNAKIDLKTLRYKEEDPGSIWTVNFNL